MKNNNSQKNIPEGWRFVKLESIFDFSAGGDVDKDCFSKEKTSKFPYPIYANALTREGLYGYSSKYKYNTPCITITGRGDIGKVFYRNEAFTPIVRLITAIPKKGDDAKFLSYACSRINFFNETTGVPQLTVPQVKKYHVIIPSSKSEQNSIVAVLESWDEVIKKLSKKIKVKKAVKNGLMQQFLTGRVRLEGFNDTWRRLNVGDIFSFLRTYAISREHLINGTSNNSGIGNIHYGDIHSTYAASSINLQNVSVPLVKDKNFSPNQKDFLIDGDLIMADASEDYDGVGVTVSIHGVGGKKIVGGLHTFVLRDNKGMTDESYRQYIFRDSAVQNRLRKIANGVSVYGISKTNLCKISLGLPTIKEQKAIARILTVADEEIKKLENKLEILKDQKKYLLNNLITGTIRTKA